jgi:hypothetical protein
MFIKKSFVDEIATSMERQLVDGSINKQAEAQSQLVKAANYLNAAAEIFDESGLNIQAELITAVLESLAAKKKVKSKGKSKPKTKKEKEAPKKTELTSDKMVSNLKEKGWVFDESDANDVNFADNNCALCGDMSYAKDKKRELWHLEKPEDPNHTSQFTGSNDELKRWLDRVKPYSGEWASHGPYESHDELEKKHNPHWFRPDGTFKLYDDSEVDDFEAEPEHWWRMVSLSEPRSFYDFQATKEEAFARKESREQYVGGECELEGPFRTAPAKRHHSQVTDYAMSDDASSDNEELLALLKDFKMNPANDFEDEDDFSIPGEDDPDINPGAFGYPELTPPKKHRRLLDI